MTNKQPVQKLTNPAGRPKGSKNKRTLVREALQEVFPDGERGFWLAVATMAKDGDMQAMTMLADRLSPKLKPQDPPIALPAPLTGEIDSMALQIMGYVSSGAITPAQAEELLKVLDVAGEVVKADRLRRSLEAQNTTDNKLTYWLSEPDDKQNGSQQHS